MQMIYGDLYVHVLGRQQGESFRHTHGEQHTTSYSIHDKTGPWLLKTHNTTKPTTTTEEKKPWAIIKRVYINM